MKYLIILTISLIIIGCGANDDGSSKTTYSSCKITHSSALLTTDKNDDLSQCWNASGKGYESKGDALAWCQVEINTYMSKKYVLGHTIEYAVESTFCP